MKHISTVAIEATVVGACLVVLYWAINQVLGGWEQWIKLFVSGALFHLVFEYTGLNMWYAMNYPKPI